MKRKRFHSHNSRLTCDSLHDPWYDTGALLSSPGSSDLSSIPKNWPSSAVYAREIWAASSWPLLIADGGKHLHLFQNRSSHNSCEDGVELLATLFSKEKIGYKGDPCLSPEFRYESEKAEVAKMVQHTISSEHRQSKTKNHRCRP